MYCKLGTIEFDGLFSFHEYERKSKTEYAELALINSKPDLQRVGIALDVIEMSIRLHNSFCDPGIRYAELKNYCDNGDILPFIDGRGNIIGTFVIEELTQVITRTDTLGAVILCECKAVLKEYVDPDRVLSRATAAKNNAFALTASSLSIKSYGPVPSPSVDIITSIKPIASSTAAAAAQVNKANVVVSQRASYIKQAIQSVKTVIAAAQAVKSKTEDYISQGVAIDSAFRDSYTAVIADSSSLLANLSSGDIAAAVGDSSVLGNSVNVMQTAALPLQKLIILR